MKKFLVLTIGLAMFFVGCASEGNEETHDIRDTQMPQTELTQAQIPPEPQHTNITIEELGATIAAAGTFWEDWWRMTGPFAPENFEQFDWDNPWDDNFVTGSPEHTAWLERQEALHSEFTAMFPEHINERGAFGILLPSSGFTNIDDILNYLSRYYTDAWIVRHLINRDEHIPHVGFPFEYYDGRLFVDLNRAGFSRPNWSTASHTLIEQAGNRAVVDTRILWGSWHRVCCGLLAPGHGIGSDTLYRFTLIDGKIDSIENPYGYETSIGRTLPWAIEELESAIVGATNFWEGWWNRAGTFGGSFDSAHWGGWGPGSDVFIEGVTDIGYIELLPSSGFANLDDIRNHLAIYFTDDRIEYELSREIPAFIEHDGLLFVHVSRWIGYSPNVHVPVWRTFTHEPQWDTATFVLVDRDGKHHAVVEMTVERHSWANVEMPVDGGDALPGEIDEVRVRFTFADGRISDIAVL
ncbi:MAG: hypothetical protein FWC70_05685 [Defluviitaleaceae bacterium]|nr:hypothetical protein [Defluviitaleaceae bacterium]